MICVPGLSLDPLVPPASAVFKYLVMCIQGVAAHDDNIVGVWDPHVPGVT